MLMMAWTMGPNLGYTLEMPTSEAIATPLNQKPWGWDTGIPGKSSE